MSSPPAKRAAASLTDFKRQRTTGAQSPPPAVNIPCSEEEEESDDEKFLKQHPAPVLSPLQQPLSAGQMYTVNACIQYLNRARSIGRRPRPGSLEWRQAPATGGYRRNTTPPTSSEEAEASARRRWLQAHHCSSDCSEEAEKEAKSDDKEDSSLPLPNQPPLSSRLVDVSASPLIAGATIR
jgi:hypothetical protein